MSFSPRLGIREMSASQSQPELVVNAAIRILEALVEPIVINKTTTVPPSSPAAGDTYIIAASASGVWSGKDAKLAIWSGLGANWFFVTPVNGFRVWVTADDGFYRYETSASPPGWTLDASGSGSVGAIDITYENSASGLTAIDVQDALDEIKALFDGLTTVVIAEYQIACSDLATDLTTGVGKAYFRAPRAFNITSARASLNTASSSGSVGVDVNINGSTIFSTGLTIDASEKTSQTAATPAVISGGIAAVADDDEITIDIDSAGATANGLIVTLLGTY